MSAFNGYSLEIGGVGFDLHLGFGLRFDSEFSACMHVVVVLFAVNI